MKHLTIRNVPEELHDALHDERERTGKSLNQTVIDLLRQRLGLDAPQSNGLARLAGTWSKEEFLEFEQATAPVEDVDTELWQ